MEHGRTHSLGLGALDVDAHQVEPVNTSLFESVSRQGCGIMIRIVMALAGTAILCGLDIARIRPVDVNFQDHVAGEVPQTCPVTKPPTPPFVPPAPYPSDYQVWIGS